VAGQFYVEIHDNDPVYDDHITTSPTYTVNGSASDWHYVTFDVASQWFEWLDSADIYLEVYNADTGTIHDTLGLGTIAAELPADDILFIPHVSGVTASGYNDNDGDGYVDLRDPGWPADNLHGVLLMSPDLDVEAGADLVVLRMDTPGGLVVPVIKDLEKKSLFQVARELGELSVKARDGKLGAADMQGGNFTVSSLGGIGGTFFTPIINAPEVAILGVSRHKMQPVWQDGEFVPRLMLPLSLSYDHRVIDGAAAVRFTRYLAELLADTDRLLA